MVTGGIPAQEVARHVEPARGARGARILDVQRAQEIDHAVVKVAVRIAHAPQGIARQRLQYAPVLGHLVRYMRKRHLGGERVRVHVQAELVTRGQVAHLVCIQVPVVGAVHRIVAVKVESAAYAVRVEQFA